jgi:ATP adenylyltransferase
LHHLWAPWRMTYVVGSRPDDCIFCAKAVDNNDAANYILYRARHNYVILNAYPYNSGHLMVVPYQHLADITELPAEALQEMFAIAQGCAQVMKDYLHAEGINLGMNIGQAAGAGIEQHLHLHLVPRWLGDTNYTTTVAGTRIVPQSLEETYRGLQPMVLNVLDDKPGVGRPDRE